VRPKAEVSADAKPVLELVKGYYTAAKSLRVEGSVTGDFDVAGRARKYSFAFTGIADGAGRFTHEPKDIGLVMGNDQRITIFDAKRNAYGWLPPIKGRLPSASVSGDVIDILIDENPAILLMLTTEPDQLLVCDSKRVALGTPDAAGNPTLRMENDKDIRVVAVDQKTGALLSMQIDFRPALEAAGAANIKRANVEVKYDRMAPADSIPQSSFEWTPPRGATEFQLKPDVEPPATAPAGNGGGADPAGGAGPVIVPPPAGAPTTQPAGTSQ
jgi:hypothetical protein